MHHDPYQECIKACNQCATVCEHCASECIHEDEMKKLTRCIQLDLVCAEICRSTAAVMAKGTDLADRVCILCSQICHICADECSKHAHMEHCKECAESCYNCAKICREMATIHV